MMQLDLSPTNARVLDLLRKNKRLGVTFDNFGRGFRLGARIFDLREAGYRILTIREHLSGDCVRARYVLEQDKIKRQKHEITRREG